jgi:hypothetical protein
MSKEFNILIDASGSMGYMKGTEYEDKYLLPDKSTRTDLVKKILIKSIIPKTSFVDYLKISTFNEEFVVKNGKRIVENGKYKSYPNLKEIFSGSISKNEIEKSITNISNPEPNGTPLWWSLSIIINQSKSESVNIIVLSDGDANDVSNYDERILETIEKIKKKCTIYFIGIDQNEVAQKKSKNLADKTGGFYVNLDVINYDESVFENMLFEFNTTITSNALKENLRITPLPIKDSQVTSDQLKNETIDIKNNEERKKEDVNEIEDTPLDLKAQVTENTKSLKLISTQLESIVKQISFIKSNPKEDEFTANEDEELNKVIGNISEKYLYTYLKSKWDKTKWINENGEQGKPYDFEVENEGVIYYIECKGTTSTNNEFFLTLNEWLFYLANRKNYRLYFVSEIKSQNPSIHRVEDLLNDMAEGKLIPCSSLNRKVKADRILFQIIE